jgi:hypothetical protein
MNLHITSPEARIKRCETDSESSFRAFRMIILIIDLIVKGTMAV